MPLSTSKREGPHLPDQPFALFVEDEQGPLFREFCDNLEEAQRKAQDMADLEGFPFLIFSFVKSKEVGRFKPRPKSAQV
jgi:hypothetical protein